MTETALKISWERTRDFVVVVNMADDLRQLGSSSKRISVRAVFVDTGGAFACFSGA